MPVADFPIEIKLYYPSKIGRHDGHDLSVAQAGRRALPVNGFCRLIVGLDEAESAYFSFTAMEIGNVEGGRQISLVQA